MGIFSKPKYVGYNFAVRSYHDGLDFQDAVVRDANSDYNLDLLNPVKLQGDGYICVSYSTGAHPKKEAVIVYVTDISVLIGFDETLINEDQIVAVVQRDLDEFANAGMPVRYESCTKPINSLKLFQYMQATAGLY